MKVEIWSDIVCPWCYIGKRRFEAALADFDGEVDVVWRSFELDPDAPARQTRRLDEALAARYAMSVERARDMMAQMAEAAAAEGLEFRFDDAKGGNTFDAHRLVHLADSQGLGGQMKERLLRAYFTEGRAITDHDALVELAAEVGLDAERVRQVLAGDAYADAVRRDEVRAGRLGVRGVPFFVVAERYGISGAQAPEVILEVLERAKTELEPTVIVAEGDEACGPDGCDVPGDRT